MNKRSQMNVFSSITYEYAQVFSISLSRKLPALVDSTKVASFQTTTKLVIY